MYVRVAVPYSNAFDSIPTALPLGLKMKATVTSNIRLIFIEPPRQRRPLSAAPENMMDKCPFPLIIVHSLEFLPTLVGSDRRVSEHANMFYVMFSRSVVD